MNISDILNRKSGKRPKGFTLIELLVVVIIIGILAAIAVPIFLNQRKAAWKASAESDAANATLAIETARTQGGTLDGATFGGGQDGAPMTITVGSETTRATVSPGNSMTAWTGKTPDGEPCYAVMTTNKSVPSWAAVRTSEGSMTTGTPPAEGSADCPRPSDPAPAPEASHQLSWTANGSDSGTLSWTADGHVTGTAPQSGWDVIISGDSSVASINSQSPQAYVTWPYRLTVVLTDGSSVRLDPAGSSDPAQWTVTITPAA